MCLASTLQSDKTATAVALTQWLVRCGVSVDSPTGELQYQTLSFSGLNFVDSSLGRWNRQFRCLRGFSIVLTGQRLELIFPWDSSVESLSPPW